MRLRIFSSAEVGGDLRKLEAAVDQWLTSEQPLVQFMQQTTLDAHVILSFLYDGEQRTMTATAHHAVEVPEVFEQELDGAELDPLSDTPLPEAELPY